MRVLVQCDGAPIPSAWQDEPWDKRLELNRRGPRENVCLTMDDLATVLGGDVPAHARDLAHIAAYVYIADQLVSRGGAADVYGDSWSRTFALCLPVSAPELWSSAPVLAALTATLGFASGDSWRFAFVGAPAASRPAFAIDPRAVRNDPDAVLLFSGGADSLCAAIAAVNRGERPVLVSHQPEGRVEGRQTVLVEELRHRFPQWTFPHCGVTLQKRQTRERDTSQRTRGFLYACLGTAAALTIELPKVVLADNGIVSLNLPINDQLIGTLASRSTHPQFLHLFNRLITAAFANPPTLENPLQLQTRAETLQILKETGTTHLLGLTRSCASAQRLPKDAPQCGGCSQCVDRRFAVLATGLTDADPVAGYTTDIFLDDLHDDARTMALSYVRFAQQNKDRDAEALHAAYPQIDDALTTADRQPEETLRRLCALVQRHCRSVNAAVEEQLALARAGRLARAPQRGSLLAALLQEQGVRLPLQTAATLCLSEEEQAEAERKGFTVRDTRLEVTGEPAKRMSNVVRSGAATVHVADTPFMLLLRLVVALHETGDGYVAIGTLKNEGGLRSEPIASGQDIYRWASDLRKALKPLFVGVAGTDLIETGRKGLRLSLHPRLVTARKSLLLEHPNAWVCQLATRLRDTAEDHEPA